MRHDVMTLLLIHYNLSAHSLIAMVLGRGDARVEPQARRGLVVLGIQWADGGWPPPPQGVDGRG